MGMYEILSLVLAGMTLLITAINVLKRK